MAGLDGQGTSVVSMLGNLVGVLLAEKTGLNITPAEPMETAETTPSGQASSARGGNEVPTTPNSEPKV